MPIANPCLKSIARYVYLLAASAVFAGAPATRAQPPETCQCLWQGSFARAYSHADAVITGEVVARKGNSADIRIGERLFDKANAIHDYDDVIRIWGNNGKLCRPDISRFAKGSHWVLALNKIDRVPKDGFNPNTPSISYGRKGDFYLSKCGANWLQLHKQFVSGNLVDGDRWTWDTPHANPVLLDLVKDYIQHKISKRVLVEAAKPPDKLNKLMEQTRSFLHQQ